MARRVPPPIEMMRALIARPTISSADPALDQSNLPVIHLLADWLQAIGFKVEIQELTDRKANLIATLGDAESGDGLVLSGHTDTVPFDDGRWTMDPFRGSLGDDVLYGLGSADMKSFLALTIEAASRIDVKRLRRPLVILATADEESSMAGARRLAAQQRRLGRYCVIGEPTGLVPVRMHKGVMMESIRIDGRSGHSSDPERGANAIDGMHAVIGALLQAREDLRHARQDPAFPVPHATLNLGSIRGGDNPNRICGHCALQFDVRPLPGTQLDSVRADLRARIAAALARQPELSWTLQPLFDGVPPFETPAAAELVEACEQVAGHRAIGVSFGTEAPYLSALGLETVVLGPGHIAQAHQPDEYLPLSHVEPCLDILARLLDRFCTRDG
ncbi:MAG: acetylornithine deacetylase [Methylotetracoccus sp.]